MSFTKLRMQMYLYVMCSVNIVNNKSNLFAHKNFACELANQLRNPFLEIFMFTVHNNGHQRISLCLDVNFDLLLTETVKPCIPSQTAWPIRYA